MSEIVDFYTAALPHSAHSESRLREEIAFLEVKASDLARRADCAYEKSLARTYLALLQARRAALAILAHH